MLFELFATRWNAGASGGRPGRARSSISRRTRRRPEGWTSADAAGLAILPGLVRYDEAARGPIRHALRVTVRRDQRLRLAGVASRRQQRRRAADGRAAAAQGVEETSRAIPA